MPPRRRLAGLSGRRRRDDRRAPRERGAVGALPRRAGRHTRRFPAHGDPREISRACRSLRRARRCASTTASFSPMRAKGAATARAACSTRTARWDSFSSTRSGCARTKGCRRTRRSRSISIAANRSGAKRSFGLLGTAVAAPRALDATEAALASRGTNPFNTAPERGVAPAGLLGLPAPPLSGLPTITDLAAAIDVAISLGDETASPRVAPRLPTMTRNETIVAGRDAAGNWSAVVGGLWVRKDSRSGLHRLGSPGSPGGEEFLGASVRTRNGLLAQELARTALRRHARHRVAADRARPGRAVDAGARRGARGHDVGRAAAEHRARGRLAQPRVHPRRGSRLAAARLDRRRQRIEHR